MMHPALVVAVVVLLVAVAAVLLHERGTQERYAPPPPFLPGETVQRLTEVTFGATQSTRKTYLFRDTALPVSRNQPLKLPPFEFSKNGFRIPITQYNLAVTIATAYSDYDNGTRRGVSFRTYMLEECKRKPSVANPAQIRQQKCKETLGDTRLGVLRCALRLRDVEALMDHVCQQMERGALGIVCRKLVRYNPCYKRKLNMLPNGRWVGGWIC